MSPPPGVELLLFLEETYKYVCLWAKDAVIRVVIDNTLGL